MENILDNKPLPGSSKKPLPHALDLPWVRLRELPLWTLAVASTPEAFEPSLAQLAVVESLPVIDKNENSNTYIKKRKEKKKHRTSLLKKIKITNTPLCPFVRARGKSATPPSPKAPSPVPRLTPYATDEFLHPPWWCCSLCPPCPSCGHRILASDLKRR